MVTFCTIKEKIRLKNKILDPVGLRGYVKPLLEKLFSNEDITEEEGEQLLSQIDSLGSYVKLRQEYRIAREKARPALKMFEEAGLSEDDALTLE